MYIKPLPGRLIRHPISNIALPVHGGKVPDEYGRRRVNVGDAEEITEAAFRAAQARATPPAVARSDGGKSPAAKSAEPKPNKEG